MLARHAIVYLAKSTRYFGAGAEHGCAHSHYQTLHSGGPARAGAAPALDRTIERRPARNMQAHPHLCPTRLWQDHPAQRVDSQKDEKDGIFDKAEKALNEAKLIGPNSLVVNSST